MHQFGRTERILPNLSDAFTKPAVQALQDFTFKVSDAVMRHREEAIEKTLQYSGIDTTDLLNHIKGIEDSSDRVDAMRNYLTDKGYHITVEAERKSSASPLSSSVERIRVWKLQSMSALDISVTLTNDAMVNSQVATVQSVVGVTKYE